jgi:hypothetical protein
MNWDHIAAHFSRLSAPYRPLANDIQAVISALRADPELSVIPAEAKEATIRFVAPGSRRRVAVGWYKPGVYVVCLDGSPHACAEQQIVTLPGVVPTVRHFLDRLYREAESVSAV